MDVGLEKEDKEEGKKKMENRREPNERKSSSETLHSNEK